MKKTILFPIATALLLTACGGGDNTSKPVSNASVGDSSAAATSSAVVEQSSEPAVTKYDVTFNWNFDGAPAATVVSVKEGETVTPPTAIERSGYVLSGWYSDAATTNPFDFSVPVTAAVTAYAGWIVNDENTVHATFYWNYEGAADPVYQTVYFTKNSRPTTPADPVREGYVFKGWYSDAACTTEYVRQRYSENVEAYAKWFVAYTFEAEHTQLTGLDPKTDKTCTRTGAKIGHGYSSDVNGTGLIFADDENSRCEASNGFYITDLYYRGGFIQFDITSDKEVTDAVLKARLSAEYFDMYFCPSSKVDVNPDFDGYDIEVNGVAIDYGKISLENVPTGRADAKKRTFTDYTLTSTLHLIEGKNVIKMITMNDHRHDTTGTMAAMAPMIDCLKLQSNATLVFDQYNTSYVKAA